MIKIFQENRLLPCCAICVLTISLQLQFLIESCKHELASRASTVALNRLQMRLLGVSRCNKLKYFECEGTREGQCWFQNFLVNISQRNMYIFLTNWIFMK